MQPRLDVCCVSVSRSGENKSVTCQDMLLHEAPTCYFCPLSSDTCSRHCTNSFQFLSLVVLWQCQVVAASERDDYGEDDTSSILDRGRDFCLRHYFQSSAAWALSPSYPTCSEDSSVRDKGAGEWSWPRTSPTNFVWCLPPLVLHIFTAWWLRTVQGICEDNIKRDLRQVSCDNMSRVKLLKVGAQCEHLDSIATEDMVMRSWLAPTARQRFRIPLLAWT